MLTRPEGQARRNPKAPPLQLWIDGAVGVDNEEATSKRNCFFQSDTFDPVHSCMSKGPHLAAKSTEEDPGLALAYVENFEPNPPRVAETSNHQALRTDEAEPLLPGIRPFFAAYFSPNQHPVDNPCLLLGEFLEGDGCMIHHIVLYKLKVDVTPQRLEEILLHTRMQLLKIPVAMNVRCGRRLDDGSEWPFFFAADFDSKERLAMFKEDPIYIKFIEETVKPNTEAALVLDYEMDPKRKYA